MGLHTILPKITRCYNKSKFDLLSRRTVLKPTLDWLRRFTKCKYLKYEAAANHLLRRARDVAFFTMKYEMNWTRPSSAFRGHINCMPLRAELEYEEGRWPRNRFSCHAPSVCPWCREQAVYSALHRWFRTLGEESIFTPCCVFYQVRELKVREEDPKTCEARKDPWAAFNQTHYYFTSLTNRFRTLKQAKEPRLILKILQPAKNEETGEYFFQYYMVMIVPGWVGNEQIKGWKKVPNNRYSPARAIRQLLRYKTEILDNEFPAQGRLDWYLTKRGKLFDFCGNWPSPQRTTMSSEEYIPECFKLTDRKRAKPFRFRALANDMVVGGKVYEVPESFWCHECLGCGCKQCKGTGVHKEEDRKFYLRKRGKGDQHENYGFLGQEERQSKEV